MAVDSSSNNILTWLDELRFCTESYEPFARPLSGGTTELALILRQSLQSQQEQSQNMRSPYQKLWECSSATSSSDGSKNTGEIDDDNHKEIDRNSKCEKLVPDKEKTECESSLNNLKHADVCRVSVVFQNCEEVEDTIQPVRVENIELYLSKDVLEWITELWYSSEEDDIEEFEEFEKYQENRVEDRPPTPKFPVVQEPVQLRKANSLKPVRGNSRSNTIHVVQAANNLNQNLEQDIQISAPLKLIWRGGKTETIDRGAVVFKNGLLQIQNDAIRSKVEMKMNSTIKNNKICEFSSPEQSLKVSVEREHQITMGSPRQRRKSVEEESPKNFNKQNILMKLLRRRSDKQLLEKKGIFKCEDIFGNKLSVLHESSHSKIPEFVRKAVELIEAEKNIKSEHIYRLSGNMATIQKIRLKIDGKNYRILEEYRNDVDVLTGCLKLFYRELVEPLIPYKAFEELHKLTLKSSSVERDKSVKSVIQKIETPHKENLLFLILHLLKIETFKQYNKMTIQSLSIVWGPSMLWYPGPEKCMTYSPYDFSMLVNGALELILTTYQTDPEMVHQLQAKNCSTEDISKDFDAFNEDSLKKSPAANSSTSKWLFGLRKTESKDKLNVSSWSLTETKKDKPSNDYFGRTLDSLVKSENSNIPKIIMHMVENIEKHSSLKGLYCKPGSKDPVGKFKKRMQKKSDISKMDPLDVAIVLLKFLQELERPLLDRAIYEDFKENVDKIEERHITNLVKEDILNLAIDHQDTIEFLVNHILHIFDHQDKDSQENIYNAWLPIFSNSTEINSHNSNFMDTILDIYRSKKGLPTKVLPLKTNFDFKFHTRHSSNSMDENYISDYDKMGIHSRTISSISDNTTPVGNYRTSMSIDESRLIKENLNIVENIRRISNKETKRVVMEEDPMEITQNTNEVTKRESDTAELATKLKNLREEMKKDDVTLEISKEDVDMIPIEIRKNVDSDENITRKDGDTIKSNSWTKIKTSIENKQLQHRIASLNLDNTKKDVDSPIKTVDNVKNENDIKRRDIDMKKIINSIKSNRKEYDSPQKTADNLKKDIDTSRKDLDKIKKPTIRLRNLSPSPARVQRVIGGKTNRSPLSGKKSIEKTESTLKEDHQSRSASRSNNPSPITTRRFQEKGPSGTKSNSSPTADKKIVDKVDTINKTVDRPQINLKGVLLSPVALRKNKNLNEVVRNDEDDQKDVDINKVDNKPNLSTKNINVGGDNKSIDIKGRGKMIIEKADTSNKPQINVKGVVLSPVALRKNKNLPQVDGNDGGVDINKIDTKPNLFAKNINVGSDNKRIDISKVHFNALTKIIGAQSLESAKARSEMACKKT